MLLWTGSRLKNPVLLASADLRGEGDVRCSGVGDLDTGTSFPSNKSPNLESILLKYSLRAQTIFFSQSCGCWPDLPRRGLSGMEVALQADPGRSGTCVRDDGTVHKKQR